MDPRGVSLQAAVAKLYQTESRKVLATLIRLLGSFELAEEGLQDAFSAALQQWPQQGWPAQPVAWLVSAGRFKVIDRLRQHKRQQDYVSTVQASLEDDDSLYQADHGVDLSWPDDELRLIFTCCHPALSLEAQLALTLREVCGLTTEQIAAAFLSSAPTIAQRIVRAKQKISQAAIPYEIPQQAQLPTRLAAVLKVIYLLFNEGYSQGLEITAAMTESLAAQAIRLNRWLLTLLPDGEAQALLALMLLQQSRQAARTDHHGDLILLAEQDRQLWDQALIREGCQLTEQALKAGRIGPYGLQAAIAAVHAKSASAATTDWRQICGLYQVLYRLDPSAVVALNYAVAIGQRDGPAAALPMLLQLEQAGELGNYHLLPAALADSYRQLAEPAKAQHYYQLALQQCRHPAEQRFLARQLQGLATSA